jgi:hypothetical protein
VVHPDPCPSPLRSKLADVTGYPLALVVDGLRSR